jgi:hypothetical protein
VTRSVNEALLLDRMVKRNPGIRREIMQASISLFPRSITHTLYVGKALLLGGGNDGGGDDTYGDDDPYQ